MNKNSLIKPNLARVNNIDINSKEYPSLLKEIKDPPEKIYYRGSWNPSIFKKTLSVVGSRRMTGYGEVAAERLVGEIAALKITIVSGFMYGIDAKAHEAAICAGGITVAVMPCGIERIHPEYQAKLYNKILKDGGLVISEYKGDMQPARWSFPRRNRIIAGLSPALLVVEAGIKSGALITAKYAKKYNRHIFAVPGPITSSVSMGTAELIKQGASLVSSSKDILDFYGEASVSSGSEIKKTENNSSKNFVMELLKEEALSMDEIIRKSSNSASETGAEITRLLIKKKIIIKEGFYYLNNDSSCTNTVRD